MYARAAQCIVAVLLLAGSRTVAQTLPVPPPNADSPPLLRLSLKQAVDIALASRGNLLVQLADEGVHQARARSAQARASLLPNIDASLLQQNQTRNLAAFGIRIHLPVPGFVFPVLAGPFDVFDARLAASQSVFDLSSIRRFQASRAGLSQAEAERESLQDQVRMETARAYLVALRAETAVETADANVGLAEALLELAADLKQAGTGIGIEVTRAGVHLANERQRLLLSQNERARAHLALLRTMGVDMDAAVELTERMSHVPVAAPTLSRAMRTALESRADWKAQEKREEEVRLNASATASERFPSVNLFGDYGSIGTGIGHAIPTRTYGVSVRVPLFDGGRRDARRSESASRVRQEQARTSDMRSQIELEIRLALDSLRSSEEQVRVAEEGLALAEKELEQAKRRYQAGVTGSIEVVDAQASLQRARENRIAALFNHNLARFDLAGAMGTIRQLIR